MTVDVMMQNSNSFPDLESPNQEDERALQIALELSNLGLLGNCDEDGTTYDDIVKGKKSQNMTECVPVPSSEHVAEIVGRQGCKIKALRAKTNTYIKTPVRGEEPVFVVTGRKEDVAMARREVQSAAEHFTQIRASRNRHALLASQQALGTISGDVAAGTITLQVRVPYRVVGLVVGPKGATIKRIQQQTHTYIVTPSRDKEPVFEVTGLPENVEKAKEEIEAHIASRTGVQQTSVDDDFRNNGTEVGSPSVTSNFMKPGLNNQNTFIPTNTLKDTELRSTAASFFPVAGHAQNFSITSSHASMLVPSTVDLIGLADHSFVNTLPLSGSYPQNGKPKGNFPWTAAINNQMNSPSAPGLPPFLPTTSSGSSLSPSVPQQSRLSPTLSDKEFSAFSPILISPSSTSLHLPVRRVGSEESTASSVASMDVGNLLTPTSVYSNATPALNVESGYSSSGTADSVTSGSPDALNHLLAPHESFLAKSQRCIVCNDNNVSAALVPCGHHLFCFSCANEVVSKSPSICPFCSDRASRALLIKQ